MGWSNSQLLIDIVNKLDPFVPRYMAENIWADIFRAFWSEDFDTFDEVYEGTGEKPHIYGALVKIGWFEQEYDEG